MTEETDSTIKPYDLAKMLAVQPEFSPEIDAYLQAKAEYDAACQAVRKAYTTHLGEIG